MKLIHGECLAEMDRLIAQGVTVDAIICDPPYGTTACKWDSVIPFEAMWQRLNKLIKPNGAVVLFGSEPFSSALRMSNIKDYRYDWIWDKVNRYNGALNANKMPMKRHEILSVFYKKLPTYNKQMREGKPYIAKQSRGHGEQTRHGNSKPHVTVNTGGRNPCSILSIKADNKKENGLHPTQKPVALMEYLIRTYTNEGETVLDFTMGSGTTGAACQNTNRNFIGIEMDDKYFKVAKKRIEDNKGANK